MVNAVLFAKLIAPFLARARLLLSLSDEIKKYIE